MAEYASFAPPPETVTSLIAEEEEWIPSLKAVGSTAAVQGVTVSTDEPGIVQKIDFESGQAVKQGDLLRSAGGKPGAGAVALGRSPDAAGRSESSAPTEFAEESRELAGGL